MGSGMLWAEWATQQNTQTFFGVMEQEKQNEDRTKSIKDNFMLYASMIWMHNVCFY